MTRSGAQIIIQFLERRGIRCVAGMPGGANLPLYDALVGSSIRHVLVGHEQAAGFIAQGMARVSGRAQVCFATSGPGATNLVTALADARLDSIPLVAITGQVPCALLGTDAFQEVDTVAICRPVVKHASLVRSARELWAALAQAFDLAESGRPGPVLLDVPKDVQQQLVEDREWSPLPAACCPTPLAANQTPREPPAEVTREAALRIAADPTPARAGPQPCAADLERALALLSAAERPVLYVGGGVIQAGAHLALGELARRQQIPVVCSLMGLGAFDPDDALYLGMLGMHGAPYTNLTLREADLLLAIGARFDDRATGKPSEFCPAARTVHVDIDARELGKLRELELGVRCDAGHFLAALLPLTAARSRPAWAARVAELRARHPMPQSAPAPEILRQLGRALEGSTVVTTDVGQHQMWVAQHLPIRGPRRLLTSGGLGTMGFGLPAAIGAALQTGARVVCVTGDGSLLLNVHELATLAELELDVTVLLFDNGALGLVRQQQTLFYEQRLSASGYRRPVDFVAVARAFGIAAAEWSPGAPFAELEALLARSGPSLIRVPLDPAEMVLPMVPPGAANHDMLIEVPAAAQLSA
jgi:acetolactate synthase I/II/III large subunit